MSYKIINGEQSIQGSQQWLSLRKNSVSATDISKIMGINPFCSAYKCYQEKMGLIEPQKANEKMKQGSLLEEEARQWFNENMEQDFKPVVIQHETYEWQIASLDGMNSRGEILEIKCGAKSHEQALNYEIAPYYYSQLQWQLYLSDQNLVWYFSYRSPEDNKFWRVDRDNDYIEKILVEAKKFYDCLMTFTPPELCDQDYVMRDDKEWRIHAEIYKEIKLKLSEYEAKESEMKLKFIEMANDQASCGFGVKVSKTVRKGNIDYSKIKELDNVDLMKYRKKNIEYWNVRT